MKKEATFSIQQNVAKKATLVIGKHCKQEVIQEVITDLDPSCFELSNLIGQLEGHKSLIYLM